MRLGRLRTGDEDGAAAQDADPTGSESDTALLLAPLLGPALILYGIVVARRTPCVPTSDGEEERMGEEDGEGGQRGDGDCEREREEEEEEDVCALARRSERKRGKEPMRFHVRVSSPPSKSSSSEEEPSKSVSPSPRPSAFSSRARCGARGAGRLYVGKMRCRGWDAAGVGGAGRDEDEEAGGEPEGSKRCVVP